MYMYVENAPTFAKFHNLFYSTQKTLLVNVFFNNRNKKFHRALLFPKNPQVKNTLRCPRPSGKKMSNTLANSSSGLLVDIT